MAKLTNNLQKLRCLDEGDSSKILRVFNGQEIVEMTNKNTSQFHHATVK